MASVPNVAVLAFYVANGCAKILAPLFRFLGGGPYPRSPAVDEAAVFLLLLLPTAYLTGVMLAHFAGVVLAYLHQPATAPVPAASTAASLVNLGQFVVVVFTLVSAWLLVIAVSLAAFSFFRGTGPGLSRNVLSLIHGEAP